MATTTVSVFDPLWFVQEWAGYWLQVLQWFDRAPTASFREHRESSLCLSPDRLNLLHQLTHCVKATSIPGVYTGAAVTLSRNLHSAKASGDRNNIHVDPANPHKFFAPHLIAHGMDSFTQAMTAVQKEVQGSGLVPSSTKIEFRKPAIVGKDVIKRIVVSPSGNVERRREVRVYTSTEADAKPITRIQLNLKKDWDFVQDDWLQALMACWRISALLAETWPNCLYYQQVLAFGQVIKSKDEYLRTELRGLGMNEAKHCTVKTVVYGSDRFTPLVTGRATIII